MAAPVASSVPSLSFPSPLAPNPKPLLPKPLAFSSAPRNPRLAASITPSAARKGFPFNRAPNEKPIIPDEWGEKSDAETEAPSVPDPPKDEDEWGAELGAAASAAAASIAASVGEVTDEWGEKVEAVVEAITEADPVKDDDEWGAERGASASSMAAAALKVTDEWGEKVEAELEAIAEADPAKNDDEWGGETKAPTPEDDKLGDLKRCLVDMLYGTEFGLRMSAEDRAEVFELIAQLEAKNPTPAPTEAPELLDGNWILLYTAFSELLPLLALWATPLVKVKRISQAINCKSKTIVNATTLSSPFATFSFSASASFEVRTASRIQVKFTEGAFQPPEISSTLDLPETLDIFGQKINLKPVQQTLNPIQGVAANITQAISGQPPLKIPIPGNRAESWLLTTYLDGDFRISRGDGGLFVLAKEGSPLLDQLL